VRRSIWPDKVRYAFLISGPQPARILAAFPELEVSDVTIEDTTLSGRVSSPTELRGLLAPLRRVFTRGAGSRAVSSSALRKES
jgi:hypothetical protein